MSTNVTILLPQEPTLPRPSAPYILTTSTTSSSSSRYRNDPYSAKVLTAAVGSLPHATSASCVVAAPPPSAVPWSAYLYPAAPLKVARGGPSPWTSMDNDHALAITRVPLPPVHIHHHNHTLGNSGNMACASTPTMQLPAVVDEDDTEAEPTQHRANPLTNVARGGRAGFATRMKNDVARATAYDRNIDGAQPRALHHLQRHGGEEAAGVSTDNTMGRSQHRCFVFVHFKHESYCYRNDDSLIHASSLRSGDYILVEADRGLNLGMVERVSFEDASSPTACRTMAKTVRFASSDEVMALTTLRLEERHVRDVVQSAVDRLGLPMTVVDVEFQYDRNKLTVYFQSQYSIDFRVLQRNLFKQFGCRIWLVMWKDVGAAFK